MIPEAPAVEMIRHRPMVRRSGGEPAKRDDHSDDDDDRQNDRQQDTEDSRHRGRQAERSKLRFAARSPPVMRTVATSTITRRQSFISTTA